ncbi:aquaporin rerated protein, other eukaryote [Exophiala aquamarina CBS 119918]|uniref:Aquaporin rerated protein, other eukaryote n=1 Tax=Exophiala aquamarina CBS 119918 TaxID=1182545 RepID=A0A072PMV2_9EURO|nr:aquaporin rerated protein, other eukaryote [Exophiala aquamarina CBS 119918]KEF60668.1 aquaporin rerated protein, other eukaryote [Exophiala aquamarina CBS 119918]
MGFLPDSILHDMVAVLGEFVGTFLFLFFAYAGCQVANDPSERNGLPVEANTLRIIYIGLSFAVSLAINCWLFYRVSGGQLNPAVTLTLYLVGAIPGRRTITICIAQVIAGIAAAGVASCTFPGPMKVDISLGAGTSISQGCFIEMFTTFLLCLTVVMLAAVKHKATFLAPLGIGMALFVGHLCSVEFTGAGINPARAFGPAVVNHSFPGYHWIYWVGPLIGALAAAAFYHILELLDWKTANIGQDFDDLEAQHLDSKKHTPRPNILAPTLTPDPLETKPAPEEEGEGSDAPLSTSRVDVHQRCMN